MAYSSIKATSRPISTDQGALCSRCPQMVNDRHGSTLCQDCYDVGRMERSLRTLGIDITAVPDDLLDVIAEVPYVRRRTILKRISRQQALGLPVDMGLAA